jgi:parallel beta-helix repeat protein
MRYWLGIGVACLISLGGTGWCSRLGGAETQVALQGNDICTHYVDNQASSDGAGSLATPWNNIAGHVNDLASGDVLCVRGDPSGSGRVYLEPAISLDANTGTSSGTEEAPIVIRTYPGEHVVVHGTDRNILEFIQVAHWEFDGFVLDKQSQGGYGVHFLWTNDNMVRNCEIHSGSEEGIHFTYGERNVVENCRIHDFASVPYKDAHGIVMAGGKDNVIRNNEIYDCTGDGIHFYPFHKVSGTLVENNHFYTTPGSCSENAIDVKVGTPIIRGNVMHGYRPNDGSCGGSGGSIGEAIIIHIEAGDVLVESNEIYDSGSGVLVFAGENVKIFNNIIHDIVTDPSVWTNIGIYINAVEAADVVHNTLVNVPRDALRIGERAIPHLNVRNNLFYNTGRSYRKDGGTAVTVDYNGWFSAAERIAGPHDIVGRDPRFVSPGDYHLRGSSPAVDVGDSAHSSAHDFDGNPRPYGPVVDLGTLEVQEPRPVTTLRVSEAVTTTDSVTVTLTWAVPGRIGQASTADHFELRYDDQVMTQEAWDQATVADANIAAGQPGQVQNTAVNTPWSGTGHLYFALRVFDGDSRVSELSNLAFWPFESVFLPFSASALASYSNGY